MESGLYIVATPIGNLGDISMRALDILRGVDLVAAEDTRHSAVLFRHFDIETPLLAYHDHSNERALARIGEALAAGGSVALVSDAGTPLISDPGFRLVRQAHEQGYRVIPVPGSCAAIAALSASGLATDRFLFEGFLPAKAGPRRARLDELAPAKETLVFYEAPHRVADCLRDLSLALGSQRRAVLARELTKAFETVLQDTLAGLHQRVLNDSNQSRGEIVLVVAGRPDVEQQVDVATSRLLQGMAQAMPGKRAAALLADYTGLRRNLLYQHLLDLKSD